MPRTERSFEVQAEIEALIKSREWPIGFRIGGLREMAERFGRSRSCMHRAILALRDTTR